MPLVTPINLCCIALAMFLVLCLCCPLTLADFELLVPGYYVDKLYTPPLQAPNHVAVSASGIIVITDWGACDRVFRLHEDGSLSTYAAPSSVDHHDVVFDSANNLYVEDWHGILWKITPEGDVSQAAEGVLGFQMDIAPDGDIFAVGGDGTAIQRVCPDGEVTVYADGLDGPCDVAVSPVTGDVYALDFGAGTVYEVGVDGTLTALVTGLLHEWSYIACSPDGELYYWAHTGELYHVSTTTGTLTELAWVKDGAANLHATDFAFDPQGRIVAVDVTYNHVIRLDLEAQTGEALWIGLGNSSGLATRPGEDGVYMSYGHPFSWGCGGVVRIEADGSTTVILDDLGPEVCGLAFDADGTGYVVSTGLTGGGWRGTIHAFSPGAPKIPLSVLPEHGYSLAVDPTTGYLWGLSYAEIWYFDDIWLRHVIPTDSVGGGVESLTFTPDGTLYATIVTSDLWSIPVEIGLYRVDPTGPTFTRVANLSTLNVCCTMGRIGGGNDGNIYWVGNGDRYTLDHESVMHMLRITPAGAVTLFGQPLPMDPSAVVGDFDTADLYVASGCGLYRILPASEATFRVESWTGNVLADGVLHAAAIDAVAADIAEWAKVSEPVEPGDVLELDPSHPGLYRLSSSTCSPLLAGVVSTEPGLVLGSDGIFEDRALLALSGIVPVKVTDEGGAIATGDILVASSTPGHAMRCTAFQSASCALVGKALQPMDDAWGVILVLLTSQ